MALFQGVELRISSGDAGTSMMTIERLQTISVPISIPRADIHILNRFRPEVRRPVVNYAPVPVSFDIIKGDNILETALGLTNPTGCLCGLTNSKSLAGYGIRNLEIDLSPLQNVNYNGQFNISSGVLNSYSVSVVVNDMARTSVSFSAFDIGFATNTNTKTGFSYNTNVVRGQDTSMSGIDISGFGISGFSLQSLNLGISISRNELSQIGSKFPVERPIIDASATIQIQGFIEGGNTSLTGLGMYDCGAPASGYLYFFLTPSCGGGPVTTYKAVNPYLQAFNQTFSVGNFAAVDMTFTIPLPINALETGNASNLIIS